MSITFSINRTVAVSTDSFSKGPHYPGSRLFTLVVSELQTYLRPDGFVDNWMVTPAEKQACDYLIDWFMRGPGDTDVYPSFQLRDWNQPFGLVFVWGWAMDEYPASGAYRQIE